MPRGRTDDPVKRAKWARGRAKAGRKSRELSRERGNDPRVFGKNYHSGDRKPS